MLKCGVRHTLIEEEETLYGHSWFQPQFDEDAFQKKEAKKRKRRAETLHRQAERACHARPNDFLDRHHNVGDGNYRAKCFCDPNDPCPEDEELYYDHVAAGGGFHDPTDDLLALIDEGKSESNRSVWDD
mgnify:CR=1 FL=1